MSKGTYGGSLFGNDKVAYEIYASLIEDKLTPEECYQEIKHKSHEQARGMLEKLVSRQINRPSKN